MTAEEERLVVLKMVSDGKLNASGAARLLDALDKARAVGESAKEERLQILAMVRDGQVNASEAARLLEALDQAQGAEASEKAKPARWFHVRVTDLATGKTKVNLNIPMSLVNVGMNMGARFVPDVDQGDMNSIRQAIKEGVRGKILDVEDLEDGERVEISID